MGNKMVNDAFKIVNAFFKGLSRYRFIYQIDLHSPFRLNYNEHIYLYLELYWYVWLDK